MIRDPNNILTWDDIWDKESLEDIPPEKGKICPDCKGKKVIYLLTSFVSCTLCKSRGIILEENQD